MKPKLNPDALPALLNRQYVPGRTTLFEGITRVLPGEVIVLKDGKIRARRRHWPDSLTPPAKLSEGDALNAFDVLFDRAVRDHLQSEVPYGVFLSGGIDSSAVAVKMAEIAGHITSFTIGFANPSVADERTLATELAEAVGSYQISETFSEDDFFASLPEMARVMDDLVADYAALPLLKLARRAKEDVKVVLSGEGGDEFFAGYGRYRPNWWQRLRCRKMRGDGDTADFPMLFKPAFAKLGQGVYADPLTNGGYTGCTQP
jgi:Asparagine synthase (glutamine-hydrolyzing)